MAQVEKTYQAQIKSDSEQKCRQIMQALMDLKNNMSDDDLILFAAKVKANPGLIQKAKNFL